MAEVGSNGYSLRIIDPRTDERWDDFVLRHPRGSLYHHSAWIGAVQATYGYTPFCIGVEDSETLQLEGIIPFLLVDSKLTGKRLVSLPMTSYCQPLVSPAELDQVVHCAFEHHPHIDYLEVKCIEEIPFSAGTCEERSLYVTQILNLERGLDEIFESFHDSNVRRKIKKADRSNLTLRMADKEEDLRRFYALETSVRKKHGLPPQPFSFFANMWTALRPRGFLLLPLVEHEGQIIAGAVILRFKDVYHYEYGASEQKYLQLGPNHKLLWEVTKLAHSEGARYFDFGRTSLLHESLSVFKERWGARRTDLFYYYFPRAAKVRTEGGFARKILASINRHLPCAVLELQGRILYRHLG